MDISLLIVVIIFILDLEYFFLNGKESIHYIRIKVVPLPFPDNGK